MKDVNRLFRNLTSTQDAILEELTLHIPERGVGYIIKSDVWSQAGSDITQMNIVLKYLDMLEILDIETAHKGMHVKIVDREVYKQILEHYEVRR